MINNRGYNNDSGLQFKNCGLNQIKGKPREKINETPMPEYVNKKMEKKELTYMNDGFEEKHKGRKTLKFPVGKVMDGGKPTMKDFNNI